MYVRMCMCVCIHTILPTVNSRGNDTISVVSEILQALSLKHICIIFIASIQEWVFVLLGVEVDERNHLTIVNDGHTDA
jgi:hypothetical protein